MVQPSSEIRQHAVETTAVARRDVVRLAEVALPLGRHLGEDVAAVGMASLVLAGSGLPEALGRAPMGLDLGHFGVLGSLLEPVRAAVEPRLVALAGRKPLNPLGTRAAWNSTEPPGEPEPAIMPGNKAPRNRHECQRDRGRRPRRHFFLGAIIMTICRPSIRGRDSITMSSPRSASMRVSMLRPSSWWLISRPRKRMLTLILSPSSRNPRILRILMA